MPDIFTDANIKREKEAEAARAAAAAKLPGPDPATGISFTRGRAMPVDPEVEAARQAAKLRLLRGQ